MCIKFITPYNFRTKIVTITYKKLFHIVVIFLLQFLIVYLMFLRNTRIGLSEYECSMDYGLRNTDLGYGAFTFHVDKCDLTVIIRIQINQLGQVAVMLLLLIDQDTLSSSTCELTYYYITIILKIVWIVNV